MSDRRREKAHCPYCGQPVYPSDCVCVSCGRELLPPAPVTALHPRPSSEPAVPVPAEQVPPLAEEHPQTLHPQVETQQQTVVHVHGSNGAWYVALAILLFGTPVGCVMIPIVGLLGLALATAVMYLAPVGIGVLIGAWVYRRYPPEVRGWYAGVTVGAGVVLSMVLFGILASTAGGPTP